MEAGDVDAAMEVWRQGDCVLGEHWFAYRVHGEDPDLREEPVDGFVVLTQTCDIVRQSAERPVLEVCPLVEMEEKHLVEIERGYRPRYAHVATLSPKRLVADLDRVMSIEKRVAAGWQRVPGWTSDAEARRFANAIGRKRTRFALRRDQLQTEAHSVVGR
ncbi:MAG: hypothetical protein AB7P03_03290 [Kofleriaceae bacterium]